MSENWTKRQLLNTDIAWLAGIVDGEGSIIMGFEKKRSLYNPFVAIGNTDKGILAESFAIMTLLGCHVTLSEMKVDRLGRFGRKRCWKLVVAGLDSLIPLLEVLIPHMASYKKVRAEAVLEFCKLRLAKRRCGGNDARRLTDEEIALAEKARSIVQE